MLDRSVGAHCQALIVHWSDGQLTCVAVQDIHHLPFKLGMHVFSRLRMSGAMARSGIGTFEMRMRSTPARPFSLASACELNPLLLLLQ